MVKKPIFIKIFQTFYKYRNTYKNKKLTDEAKKKNLTD